MNKKSTPTIADVAREAGVSTATVSRVLNGTSRVIAETARRVQAAIDALGYTPMPAARILAGRKTRTLGLVIPEIGGTFFAPLLRGIESAARQAGFSLLIQAGAGHTALALNSQLTDGLLAYTGALDAAALSALAAEGLPVVQLYASPPGADGAPVVTVDNPGGAALIMAHLVKAHHCTQIAFLAGPESEPDALARLEGYRQGLAQHGLAYDNELVAPGGFNQETARQSVAALLQKGVQMDAIFAADDESAAGALTALRSAGLCVPEDICLVGFDDVPFAAYLDPPLTTVHAPSEVVGRAAVQALVHLILGEEVDQFTCLPTTLVVRRSCGCTPGRNNPFSEHSKEMI